MAAVGYREIQSLEGCQKWYSNLGDQSKKSYTLFKMKTEWPWFAATTLVALLTIATLWLRVQGKIDGFVLIIVMSAGTMIFNGMIIYRSLKARKSKSSEH